MQVLFRLKRKMEFKGDGLLGYPWLEIIAISAVALGKPEEGSESWSVHQVVNDYLCRSEDGLCRLREDDVWSAIEAGELELDMPH